MGSLESAEEAKQGRQKSGRRAAIRKWFMFKQPVRAVALKAAQEQMRVLSCLCLAILTGVLLIR